MFYIPIYFIWTCILCIENGKDKRLLWLVRPTSWSHLMEEFCSNFEDSELLDTFSYSIIIQCTNTWSWALWYIIIILILFWLYRKDFTAVNTYSHFSDSEFYRRETGFCNIANLPEPVWNSYLFYIYIYILFVAECQVIRKI